MRDPARIDRILALVGKIWRSQPDLRLFQLLENAVRARDEFGNYHVEDDATEAALRGYYCLYASTSGAVPPLTACQWGLSCNERGCPMPCGLDSKVTWHPKDGCRCAYHAKREPAPPLTCETCGGDGDGAVPSSHYLEVGDQDCPTCKGRR